MWEKIFEKVHVRRWLSLKQCQKEDIHIMSSVLNNMKCTDCRWLKELSKEESRWLAEFMNNSTPSWNHELPMLRHNTAGWIHCNTMGNYVKALCAVSLF